MGGSEKVYHVDDIDLGVAALIAHAQKHASNTYALLSTDNKGVLTVTEKDQKPCYGELRPYLSKVNPKQADTRGKDSHPGDLPHGFPDGEILAVSAAFKGPISKDTFNHELTQFLLDKDTSPWVRNFPEYKVVVNDEPWSMAPGTFSEKTHAHLWTDTSFGPTIAVSMLMTLRNINTVQIAAYDFFKKTFPKASKAALATMAFCASDGTWYTTKEWGKGPITFNWSSWYYNLALHEVSLANVWAGKPFDLDGGVTWRERGAYNRPWIHNLFGHGYASACLKSTKTEKEEALADLVSNIEKDIAAVLPAKASAKDVNLLAAKGY